MTSDTVFQNGRKRKTGTDRPLVPNSRQKSIQGSRSGCFPLKKEYNGSVALRHLRQSRILIKF